ncbi:UDP-glycosyltransferase 92A1-like [Aristolochia californica]|uniref:UDP-glycosyltransferase 92A1-like n=1 Tax=Aristolochia californica TaxID=171875 RepID=UPI0035E2371E
MEATDHVIMFPFMAQGHLIPFIALAKHIVRRSKCRVTLLSTPLNIQKFRSTLHSDTAIRLESLPFNSSDHGLPPNTENTDGLQLPYWIRLFHASRTLQPAFDHFLSDFCRSHGRPLCIIADIYMGWTVQTARSLGIYHTTFSTCGAYGTSAFFSLWTNLPHAKTDEEKFNLPGFPESFWLDRSQLSVYMRAADGTDDWSSFFQGQIRACLESDGMLCNTVEEMERVGLVILRGMTKKPVWCVAPSLSSSLLCYHASSSASHSPSTRSTHDFTGKEPGISIQDCVDWLNIHPPSSILYISFGSQNTISVSQIMNLARGLEAAGHPFIWVIRPPVGHDVNADFRGEWLPAGFEERMKEKKQGIVVRKWAPQLEILTHKSTGAFLSHCGWNSVLESLSQGVPIIAWPLASEQFYNSKMMEEELGVSVELARGTCGEVAVDSVVKVTQMVLCETEKSADMKRKALVVSEIIRASTGEDGKIGSAIDAVEDFIRTARSKK